MSTNGIRKVCTGLMSTNKMGSVFASKLLLCYILCTQFSNLQVKNTTSNYLRLYARTAMFSRINVTMALATFFSLAVSTSTAAISQACQNELEALAVDSTLLPLKNDVLVNANQELASCNADSRLTCNVDFSDLDVNFRLACVAAGGQIFIIDTTQRCTNGSDRFTINLNNQALCVGQSCDKDNVEEVNDQNFDMQDDLNEETFGAGTTCTSDTEIEGSSGGVLSASSSSTATIMGVGTALVVASAVVFL
jgi:hypothetical protein